MRSRNLISLPCWKSPSLETGSEKCFCLFVFVWTLAPLHFFLINWPVSLPHSFLRWVMRQCVMISHSLHQWFPMLAVHLNLNMHTNHPWILLKYIFSFRWSGNSVFLKLLGDANADAADPWITFKAARLKDL